MPLPLKALQLPAKRSRKPYRSGGTGRPRKPFAWTGSGSGAGGGGGLPRAQATAVAAQPAWFRGPLDAYVLRQTSMPPEPVDLHTTCGQEGCGGALVVDTTTSAEVCSKCGVVAVLQTSDSDAAWVLRTTGRRRAEYSDIGFFHRRLLELAGEEGDFDVPPESLRRISDRLTRLGYRDDNRHTLTPSIMQGVLKHLRLPKLYRHRWALTRMYNPDYTPFSPTPELVAALLILFRCVSMTQRRMQLGRLSNLLFPFLLRKFLIMLGQQADNRHVPYLRTRVKAREHEAVWAMLAPVAFSGHLPHTRRWREEVRSLLAGDVPRPLVAQKIVALLRTVY